MSLTKLSLAGIVKLFPPRDSLVSDIPAGDRKNDNLFYSVIFLQRESERRKGYVVFVLPF